MRRFLTSLMGEFACAAALFFTDGEACCGVIAEQVSGGTNLLYFQREVEAEPESTHSTYVTGDDAAGADDFYG